MCLISLSSEQRDLYISRYIYKYTYGPPGPDWLLILWARDRIMVYHLHAISFFFLIKVTDLPSSFHVQSPNLSVLIDSCNLLTQAVKAERLGMSWCFLWGRHMIIALSPGESMRLVKMDSHQGRKREPNALIWRSVGKTWNVTRILVYFRHLENFKNKHL